MYLGWYLPNGWVTGVIYVDILTSNKILYPPIDTPLSTIKPKVCTRLGECTYCPNVNKIKNFASHHTGKECDKLTQTCVSDL